LQLKAKVLYLASMAAFMRSFAHVIYVPAQKDILFDFGTTTALFGLTMSLFALVFAVSQLFLGPLVDRFESKRILLVGLSIFTIGSLGGVIAQNIEWLFLVRLLQALGIAAAVIVGLALISDVIPKTERGRAMGVFEIFNAAGAAAGPIIGAFIAVWLGWRVDFILIGFLGFALLLFVYWQLPEHDVIAEKVGLRHMFTILRTPATLGAIALGLVQFYALFTIFTILPPMLSEQMGLDIGAIGLLISLLPIGAMLGSLVGGHISDRIRVRNILIPGSICAVIGYSSLTYLSRTADVNTLIVIIGGIIFLSGISIGFCLPVQLKIMVDHFPSIRGTANGLLIFFRFMGASMAPIITGYLADKYSLTAGFGSAAILLSIGAVMTILLITDKTPTPLSVMIDELHT
jgi:DHA1 family bicyclomycin/chloramphenicol resistance-like MFS transporter